MPVPDPRSLSPFPNPLHSGYNSCMENAAAYIPLDRRRALAAGAELPVHTSGAALFAHISGFTPLTEALVRAFWPAVGRR